MDKVNVDRPVNFKEVVDSGERQDFDTGSKRDTDKGKGNPSLVPSSFLKLLLSSYSSDRRKQLVFKFENVAHCYEALEESLCDFSEDVPKTRKDVEAILIGKLLQSFKIASHLLHRADDVEMSKYGVHNANPHTYALRRLAVHYQNGAIKYDKNNWRKGQPISRYYDSCIRHAWAFSEGKVDEDHLAAVLWNIVAMITTIVDVSKGILPPELFDLPYTYSELSPYYAKFPEEQNS